MEKEKLVSIIPPPPHKKREASFELLRIICMLLIILSHFEGHGGWLSNLTGYNLIVAKILRSFFYPSVNLFVMISAYFSCLRENKTIQWKKIGKLYLQLQFYNLLLFVVFLSAGLAKFDYIWLMDTLFPLARGKYWFFSAYVFMMIASPLLNFLIRRLSRKQHFVICIFIALIAVCQNAIFSQMLPLSNGYSGVWFCLLYIIAAYIRKYDVKFKNKFVAAACTIVYLDVLTAGYFFGFGYSDFPTLFASIFVFLAFKSFKIGNVQISKAICFLSSLTFGVYLIHDSPEMRGFMYQNIFFSQKFYNDKLSCLIMIGFILATFVSCAIAEFLRQQIFKLGDMAHAKTLKGKIHTPQFLTRLRQKFDVYFFARENEYVYTCESK